MAHYIEQPAPWDPNDLVYYVEIRPWPNSETFYYAIVLHYDSGWQTWIGQFHGFQEEYDPKHWETLHSLGAFPKARLPMPNRATSSLVAPPRLPPLQEVPTEEEPYELKLP